MKKVVIIRDVIFKENEMPYLMQKPDNTQVEVELCDKDVHTDDEQVKADTIHTGSTSMQESQSELNVARARPRRQTKLPSKFSDYDMLYYALSIGEEIEYHEPSTYREAVRIHEKDMWLTAMQEEIDSLYKNQTWVLVLRSSKQKVVGCRWIFKKKLEASNHDQVRLKARLVAKGFTQREGIDYNEVFSLVVKHSSIRKLLAIVVDKDWELEQLDVKTAFLYGDLEETIYMEQHKGFIKKEDEDKYAN